MTFVRKIADKLRGEIQIQVPKEFPEAPCGKQVSHYYWVYAEKLPCPVCAADRFMRQREQREQTLVDKVAAALEKRA